MQVKLFLKLVVHTKRGLLNKKKYSLLEYTDSKNTPTTYVEVFNGNKRELVQYLAKRLHITQARVLQGSGLINNRVFFVKNIGEQ